MGQGRGGAGKGIVTQASQAVRGGGWRAAGAAGRGRNRRGGAGRTNDELALRGLEDLELLVIARCRREDRTDIDLERQLGNEVLWRAGVTVKTGEEEMHGLRKSAGEAGVGEGRRRARSVRAADAPSVGAAWSIDPAPSNRPPHLFERGSIVVAQVADVHVVASRERELSPVQQVLRRDLVVLGAI